MSSYYQTRKGRKPMEYVLHLVFDSKTEIKKRELLIKLLSEAANIITGKGTPDQERYLYLFKHK